MKFKFEIDENSLNYVKEVGLPEDCELCFVIYKDDDSENGYDYFIGGYSSDEKQFYMNFGFGGMCLEEDNVIAWVPLLDSDKEFLKVID